MLHLPTSRISRRCCAPLTTDGIGEGDGRCRDQTGDLRGSERKEPVRAKYDAFHTHTRRGHWLASRSCGRTMVERVVAGAVKVPARADERMRILVEYRLDAPARRVLERSLPSALARMQVVHDLGRFRPVEEASHPHATLDAASRVVGSPGFLPVTRAYSRRSKKRPDRTANLIARREAGFFQGWP